MGHRRRSDADVWSDRRSWGRPVFSRFPGLGRPRTVAQRFEARFRPRRRRRGLSVLAASVALSLRGRGLFCPFVWSLASDELPTGIRVREPDMPELPTPNVDTRERTTTVSTLSRRDFLMTASAAVGGFAVAQGPAPVPTARPTNEGLP